MREKEIIELTYFHKCKVIRHINSYDPDGFSSFVGDSEVYSDIKCAVSFSRGSTESLEDTQTIEYLATLFIGNEYEIIAGDKVVADVYGKEYVFTAGECVKYKFHQQIPLIRKSVA